MTAKEQRTEEVENVEDIDVTEEDTVENLKAYEGDILNAILDAAKYSEGEETYRINIVRNNTLMFSFRIRPLSEEEYETCRTKNTKYVRNRRIGVKVPETTNSVRYRSQLIYTATVPEDRQKIWDNKAAWGKLNVASGIDAIDRILKSGEKDAILEQLDKISGYGSELEETIKN